MQSETLVKVWDPAVRFFHWSLAGTFFLAYLLEDAWLELHVWAGYGALGLVGFRLLWGFIGTAHARFKDFVVPPRAAGAYLLQVMTFRAPHYLGHNPAGGAMVLALLASVALTGFSGIATYGAVEFSGPLAGLTGGLGPDGGNVIEDIHEFLANTTLWLVAFHLAGVLIASIQHRENLVHAMVTGKKRIEEK